MNKFEAQATERVKAVQSDVARGGVLAMLLAAYAWLLWHTYDGIIAPTFGYLGERSQPPSPGVFVLAFVATWAVGLLLPRKLTTAADFSLWLLYVLMVVPTMLVPHFTGICTTGEAILLTVAGGLSYPLIVWIVRGGSSRIVPLFPLSSWSFWIMFWTVTVVCYAALLSLVPVELAVPSLTDVYDLRSQYRLLVGSAGSIVGYLVRILGNVINPILICRGLFGGPRALIAVGLFGQLVVFSVTGFKLTLLSGVGIVALAAFFRLNRARSPMALVIGAVGLVLSSTVADQASGGILFSTIFVYRLILSAGTLPAAYASFFADRPHFMWSDSFLSSFIQPIYPRTMVFTVGEYQTGSPLVTLNSHYVADGYGNFGLWGVLIEALVLALLLIVSASAGRGLSMPMLSCLLLTPLMALANSSPITSILSNGFIFLIPMLMLMPRRAGEDASDRHPRRRHRKERNRATTARPLGEPPSTDPLRNDIRSSR